MKIVDARSRGRVPFEKLKNGEFFLDEDINREQPYLYMKIEEVEKDYEPFGKMKFNAICLNKSILINISNAALVDHVDIEIKLLDL